MLPYSRALRALPQVARSSRYPLARLGTTVVVRLQHSAPAQREGEVVAGGSSPEVNVEKKQTKPDYAKINAEKKEKLLLQIKAINEEVSKEIQAGVLSNTVAELFFKQVEALPRVPRTSYLVAESFKDSITSIMEKATKEANDVNQQRVPISPLAVLKKAISHNVALPSHYVYVVSQLLAEGDSSNAMSLWVTYLENNVDSKRSFISLLPFYSLVTIAYLDLCISQKSEPELEKLQQLLQVKSLPRVHTLKSSLNTVIPQSDPRFKPLSNALDGLFLFSVDPNATSLIVEAMRASELGETRTVHQTWNNIRKASELNGKKITEDTMVAFMKMFNTLNLTSEAQGIWNTLINSGIHPSTNAWNNLLVTVSKTRGPFAKRLGQVEYVKSKIPSPDDQTFATLIRVYTTLKEFEKVEEIAKDKMDISIVSQAYLQSLASRGDFSVVEQFLTTLKKRNIQLNQTSYNMVLAAALRQGHSEKIPELMKDMKREGIKPDIATYTIVMDHNLKELASRGEVFTDHAFELFFEELAQNGIKPNQFTFTAIMDNLAKNGSVEAAESFFSYLQAKKMASPVSYISLITSEFEAGRPSEGEDLFREFLNERYRVTASHWAALFKGLSRNGKTEELKSWLSSLEETPALLNRFSIYFLLTAAKSRRDRELAEQVVHFIARHKMKSVISSKTSEVIKDLERQMDLQLPEYLQG